MLLPPVPGQFDIIAGLLVLLRVSSLILFLPVLGHQMVPSQAKIGLIAILAILLYPVVRHTLPDIAVTPLSLALMAGQEIMVGGMLGLMAQIMFGAVQMAGQLISYQLGLAIANVFDPSTSAQIAIVGQFAVVLAMLLWVGVGAHHAMILSLADSFTIFPMGHAWSLHGWQAISDAMSGMFVLAIRLSAPVLLLLMLSYTALGLLSRAVPQIQIFFVSSPLTIGMGMLVFALSMPAFVSMLADHFSGFARQVPFFLSTLAGS